VTSTLSWNLIDDVRELLSFHFMLNAMRAGTIVAIVSAVIGYFMVLRRQTFAGHTLAVVGFPGAAGAFWLGINASFGYFGFCIAAAVIIAWLPGNGQVRSSVGGNGQESAVIGTLQGLALACGFLFLNLSAGFSNELNNLLFGVIIGVTDEQVLMLLISGIICLAVIAMIARPLLFVSIDADVARARGLRPGILSLIFLLLLGISVAGTSQITGSLLVFALLVAPAATAMRLTARPGLGLLLSVVISVAVTWLGEGIAFFSPYPIGFWVTTFAFCAFLLAAGYRAMRNQLATRPGVAATA
jgi:zinc/manganese transport system permease protein